jgi:alkanesulfonate monooxygenase SsuD/methylene tetrahydromethanopterin reductase-like flavin-dependent oxidoreductase (luciferase family)
MRHGIVILPQQHWSDARRTWSQAEELGFDHAWTYDHLSWRSLADQRWMATIPTLTAAATVTSTIRLGTFVTSPNFRHPVPFAKDLATVDDIADGRFLLGIGSGGTGFDADVLGYPRPTPRERHDRFVEFVRDLDVLLRFEEPGSGGISFDGEWFRGHDARMVGSPAQSPRMPFVIAADGPKGLRLSRRKGTAASRSDDHRTRSTRGGQAWPNSPIGFVRRSRMPVGRSMTSTAISASTPHRDSRWRVSMPGRTQLDARQGSVSPTS